VTPTEDAGKGEARSAPPRCNNARHRHRRVKASEAEIAKALTGNWRDEHLFVLGQALAMYLLDEPEAALSPSRQLAALRTIDELVKDGSQFVIATHSPILLPIPSRRSSCLMLLVSARSPMRTSFGGSGGYACPARSRT